MKRDQILSDLFRSDGFQNMFSKMQPQHLQEDLRQEVALVLCELSEEDIINRHQAKTLLFYACRVMLNMIYGNQPKHPFYKKFRWFSQMTSTDECLQYSGSDSEPIADTALADLEDLISTTLTWYEREVLNQYLQNDCNGSKTARAFDIPPRTLNHTISKTKKKLRDKITSYDPDNSL